MIGKVIMKKILIIIFTIAIFLTGGIFGYKKIVADEREDDTESEE